ncbi:MAG: hypothetical protein ABJN35_11430 [Erythrobacter sp.]
MKLWTENTTVAAPSGEIIAETILGLKEADYAILGPADEVFIQTMLTEHGYLLEKRDGDAASHYEAIPLDGRSRLESKSPWWAFWAKPSKIHYFSSDEIIEAFCCYLEGNANPAFSRWSQIWI